LRAQYPATLRKDLLNRHLLRLLPPHAKGRDCRVQANPEPTPGPGSHAACLTPGLVSEFAVRRAAPPASSSSASSSNAVDSNRPPHAPLLTACVRRFVNILGHKPIEYNQEQARMKCYNGEESLIRSFPSKVGVSCRASPIRELHTPTTYAARFERRKRDVERVERPP